jgi:hypothetical protein
VYCIGIVIGIGAKGPVLFKCGLNQSSLSWRYLQDSPLYFIGCTGCRLESGFLAATAAQERRLSVRQFVCPSVSHTSFIFAI